MRYLQAAASFLVSLGFVTLCGVVGENMLLACIAGALGFFVLACILVGVALWDRRDESLYQMAIFIEHLSKLNSDQMEVLGYQFPHIRYQSHGRVAKPMFENTDVPMGMLHEFLRDSNDYYVSPQRNWFTAEKPEWAWIRIYKWLVDHKMVIADSAAGNTSHHWIGESYKRMMSDYWMAGRIVADLNGTGEKIFNEPEAEEVAPAMSQQVYAYDNPLPHLKKVSGSGQK
jgi:hypothetical protein